MMGRTALNHVDEVPGGWFYTCECGRETPWDITRGVRSIACGCGNVYRLPANLKLRVDIPTPSLEP